MRFYIDYAIDGSCGTLWARGCEPGSKFCCMDGHGFASSKDSAIGRAAGPIRNARMLDEFKPDLVVAFKVKAKSRGTNDCIQKAKDRGIPVIVYIGPEKVEDTRATQARK